jgi:hypothetical protein
MTTALAPTPIRPLPDALTGITTAQLLAEPDEPVPFHTPDLIPAEGLVVLAAAPKVGKTILMSQLALVTGSDDGPPRPLFLGRVVEPGRVLYVLEEGSRESLRFRVRRQMEGLSICRSSVTWALQAHLRLDNERSVKNLRARVADIEPGLVVLDPLNRLHGLDENRPSEMARVMGAAVSVVQEAHCAVVVLHHLTKPNAEHRGRLVDRIRGAGSIVGATDANLVMEPQGAGRVRLEGEFRDAEPITLFLDLDPERLLFSQSLAERAPGKVPTVDLLTFLDERTRVTARDVMDRFGCSKVTALAALEETPGLDRTTGSRGQLHYFRTVQ